jgi:hypothetical protein
MSNNRIILEGCLVQYKSTNEIELKDSEIFELFSLTQCTKSYDLSYENILNSIVDGGNDGGIDSIIVLIDDEVIESIDELLEYNFSKKTNSRFIISQCKKENSFKEGSIDKLITTLPELFDLQKNEKALLTRFNADLVTIALLVNQVWQKTAISGGKIFIDFIYSCNASEIEINGAFNCKIDQLKTLTKKIFSNDNISYSNFSCAELLKLYQAHKTNRLTLEFKEQPLSTSYKEFGIGYVGMVKLADYKSFLTSETTEIRDDLFESNIRHFQGEVDVNKKIKSTLENIEEKDFWWLNNGITIIAEAPNQVGKKLAIENVQIVNGLQTSYSIYNSHNGDLTDERSVLVKVIINSNKETIDNIIASTNSQNPVSATLLRATEETQRNLEIFFYNKGYYYDRRKNYYKNQGKPASKIFSIQYTAQAIRSIVFNDPHSARAKPTSLLKDDKTYNEIFDPSKNYEGYLNCCLINKKSNDFWLNIDDSTKKGITANFKLHLGWLGSKVTIGKNLIAFDELSTFDINLFDQAKFDDSIDLLLESITEFQAIHNLANLINMAKSGDFTKFIIEKLDAKY